MNSETIRNSQLSTTVPKNKQKQKQTKQTIRIRTESQEWRSHGGLSVVWERGRIGGKDTGNKKHNR